MNRNRLFSLAGHLRDRSHADRPSGSRPRFARFLPGAVATTFAAFLLILAASSVDSALPAGGQIVGITGIKLYKPLHGAAGDILEITAQILPGWHINSDLPLAEDYIPTRVEVRAPAGIKPGKVKYPPPEMARLGFSGEQLSLFTGTVRFTVPLEVAPDYEPGRDEPVTINIDYQACDNNECLRPTSVSSTFNLASASFVEASPIDGVSAGFASGEAGLERTFEGHGYLLGFLLVLLGGLALNLTPCVYPLMGVTVAYFGNQGGTHRRIAMLATTYVLGIALMFSAVGVAVALSGGLFGAALQNPYVLVAIAALMVVLALSSFGVFALQAPQWMMRWAGASRPGFVGAFAMGLGMGVIAAPCIGPIVLGLLLMVERSGSVLFGFSLFFTLAIGMGLPYVGLAVAAGSIRRMPRSGEWLRWTEQLFGLVLIGLAIYFLEPVVPNHLINRLLPLYTVASGIFLGFVTPAGRTWRPFMVFRVVLGTLSVAALIYLVILRGPRVEVVFEPFMNSSLASARSEGKPVVVDFSADWCIPCREMENTTYVDPAVVRASAGFVRLRADLTAHNSANEELIDRFEIKGVPTTLFIDSSGQIRKREVGYLGPNRFLADLKTID